MPTPLENRIRKLESKGPDIEGFPKIIFVSFQGFEASDDEVEIAFIAGGNRGQINREDGEAKGAFLQRGYKACVTAHGLDQRPDQSLSDSDRQILRASISPELALQYYEQVAHRKQKITDRASEGLAHHP